MSALKTVFRLLLGRRLPTYGGPVRVEGLHAPVRIRRDEWAIPYIDAETEPDAWLGLGFCHGQDRAGQLEVILRAVRGTLSEIAGKDGLPIDRLTRRMGIRRAAESQWPLADADIRANVEAYCRGVNQGAVLGGRRLAHEFALLRCRPTAWEPEDVQGFAILLCFMLAANWDIELARLEILQKDGPEALAALDPTYPAWLPVSRPPFVQRGDAVDHLAHDMAVFAEHFGLGGASNTWAVAPQRTATGRPILANDPHMLPTAPCNWYLARLATPEWTTIGATFAGVPAMPAGHNGHIAWGVTAAQADQTDLFLEEIGSDGRSVRQGDGFVPCEVRREEIRVRFGRDVVEEVLVTPRGPIIGPSLNGHQDGISISAPWLMARKYRGLFGVHKVRDAAEIGAVFDHAADVNCSMVYAEVGGSIGWQLVGDFPQRKKGYGNLPLPGWDPEAGWHDEMVPRVDLPRAHDPEVGYVATANNQPELHEDGPFLGVDWLDGFRLASIVERLRQREDWDVDSSLRLQLDVTSRPWRELREVLLAIEPITAPGREALELLRTWHGEVAADSPAAAVFEHFLCAMVRRIVEAKAPRAAATALGAGAVPEFLPYNLLLARRVSHVVSLLRDQPAGFLPDPWAAECAAGLDAAAGELRRLRGADPTRWAWGELRPLTLKHPFGDKPPLDRLFNVSGIRCGGDATTIHQAQVDFRDPGANPNGVPTVRFVLDVGAWDRSRYILLGGQSGNPLSPHYTDMIPLWQEGRGVPIPWSEDEAEARARHRQELVPAGARDREP